jgi:hypothetical protein
VRGEIWDLYADLKAYRRNPDPALRPGLEERFDTIFTQRTSYITLDRTLKRLSTHKSELLLVLERPDLVLHTNGSESDIRGYVKWRKISGDTRSDLGRLYTLPELSLSPFVCALYFKLQLSCRPRPSEATLASSRLRSVS